MDENENRSSWNNFVETGKIDDYLNYCQNRKPEPEAHTAKGISDAAKNRRGGPVGPQDSRR